MSTNPWDEDKLGLIVESISYSSFASVDDSQPKEQRQLRAGVRIDRGCLPAAIKDVELRLIEHEGGFPSSDEIGELYVRDDFLEVCLLVRAACISNLLTIICSGLRPGESKALVEVRTPTKLANWDTSQPMPVISYTMRGILRISNEA